MANAAKAYEELISKMETVRVPKKRLKSPKFFASSNN